MPFRVVLAFVALAWARSCGFTPADHKNEGEPCTRSTECREDLECIAGVCSAPRVDGGSLDASSPADASARDAEVDADASSEDAAIDAAMPDADLADGAIDAAIDGG